MQPALGVDVTTYDHTVVVSVSGELDTDTSPLVARATGTLDLRPGGPALVLDLAGVTFIDAGALNMLLALRHHARGHGTTLRLRAVPAQAQQLLDLTGTRHLFTYCPGPTAPGPGTRA
ncbi:STAS domain-containing protein [Streptomyces sp. NPDC127069]|uniref:STAS domain-containing protein n=1 Tax=Streptomyces sp. NPDC127069 TaxID=3347128 RepID=UPI0036461AF1